MQPTALAKCSRCFLTEDHLVFNIYILPDGQPEKPVRDRKFIGKHSRKMALLYISFLLLHLVYGL